MADNAGGGNAGGAGNARAAQAARTAAANRPGTAYDFLIRGLDVTGISWLAGWAGWSITHPREATAILAGKMKGNTNWERLAKEAFLYDEDPLTLAMLRQEDAGMQRLANDRRIAGMTARASDGNLAIYAYSYQKKYKNNTLSPADIHLLVCATIENLRLNAIKNDLKDKLKIKSKNLTVSSERALVADANSRAVFPGVVFDTEVDTRPAALKEFIKTALMMSAEEYPDLRLAEIFDFDAVRGLIRENAEIPPIRNNDGANAFVEHFCTLADGGPERLDQAARTEIAAGAAGPAGPAGASDRTNFRGIMSRLKKPRAAGETVGLPVRAPLMVADEQEEQDEQEGPSNAKRLRIANGNQSGGYRKTRRRKRKTRSKSRSQKRRG